MKQLKLNYVNNLFQKHFEQEWRSLDNIDLLFYKNVIDNTDTNHNENDSDDGNVDVVNTEDYDFMATQYFGKKRACS